MTEEEEDATYGLSSGVSNTVKLVLICLLFLLLTRLVHESWVIIFPVRMATIWEMATTSEGQCRFAMYSSIC